MVGNDEGFASVVCWAIDGCRGRAKASRGIDGPYRGLGGGGGLGTPVVSYAPLPMFIVSVFSLRIIEIESEAGGRLAVSLCCDREQKAWEARGRGLYTQRRPPVLQQCGDVGLTHK